MVYLLNYIFYCITLVIILLFNLLFLYSNIYEYLLNYIIHFIILLFIIAFIMLHYYSFCLFHNLLFLFIYLVFFYFFTLSFIFLFLFISSWVSHGASDSVQVELRGLHVIARNGCVRTSSETESNDICCGVVKNH